MPSLLAFQSTSLFGKVICSLSSHLLYILASLKGLLLSPSREEDAPCRALHHFRLADETATRSSLAACADAGSSARARGGSECAIRGRESEITSGYLATFCDSLMRRDSEQRRWKKAAWGGKKEMREWKTLKQSDKQWHKTLFKSFSVGVHQAVALKPLSACKFQRKDSALKSKL